VTVIVDQQVETDGVQGGGVIVDQQVETETDGVQYAGDVIVVVFQLTAVHGAVVVETEVQGASFHAYTVDTEVQGAGFHTVTLDTEVQGAVTVWVCQNFWYSVVVDVIVVHLGKYLTSVWVETTVIYCLCHL